MVVSGISLGVFLSGKNSLYNEIKTDKFCLFFFTIIFCLFKNCTGSFPKLFPSYKVIIKPVHLSPFQKISSEIDVNINNLLWLTFNFFVRRSLVTDSGAAVLGVSYRCGICEPDYQVSVNEDGGFFAWVTAAHELGHKYVFFINICMLHSMFYTTFKYVL